jgi:hypothetical protein
VSAPAELAPLFSPGERIRTADEFVAAVEKIMDRRQALVGYLNARRKFYGDDCIEMARLCGLSVMYLDEKPKNERRLLNRYEKALVRLSNQVRCNLVMHPVWLEATSGGKEIGSGKQARPLGRS